MPRTFRIQFNIDDFFGILRGLSFAIHGKRVGFLAGYNCFATFAEVAFDLFFIIKLHQEKITQPRSQDRAKVLGTRLKMTACNRPRSIYQYSGMAPRLSGQTSIFGVVFFVSKSLLGIERQKKL